jgi:hypothetical protein
MPESWVALDDKYFTLRASGYMIGAVQAKSAPPPPLSLPKGRNNNADICDQARHAKVRQAMRLTRDTSIAPSVL